MGAQMQEAMCNDAAHPSIPKAASRGLYPRPARISSRLFLENPLK